MDVAVQEGKNYCTPALTNPIQTHTTYLAESVLNSSVYFESDELVDLVIFASLFCRVRMVTCLLSKLINCVSASVLGIWHFKWWSRARSPRTFIEFMMLIVIATGQRLTKEIHKNIKVFYGHSPRRVFTPIQVAVVFFARYRCVET